MKIGVFDSGIGGLSVARAIQLALPEHEIIFRNDHHNMPYGTKTPQQLLKLVKPIVDQLVADGCQVIVIACNTVSSTIIDDLRKVVDVELIAMVPMVGPAARQTKTGTIAVCATPTTLASSRYKVLKGTYAKDINVVEPDCSDWAGMIERNNVEEAKIASRIEEACNQGADVIVLGCTHYHWIEDLISEIAAKRAVVIQPEQPVIEEVKRALERLA